MKAGAILRTHWVGFLFLTPFLLMHVIHRYLGFSDALLAQPEPGEIEAGFYNLVMIAVFYGGVFAFAFHAMFFAPQQKRWLMAKGVALIGYWSAVLLLA